MIFDTSKRRWCPLFVVFAYLSAGLRVLYKLSSISDWKIYVPVAPPQAQKAICPIYIYMLTETLNWSDSTIGFFLIFHALMFNFLEKKIGSKIFEVAEMGHLDQSSLSKVSRLHKVSCNIIYICMYMRSGQLRFTLSCNLHKPKLHNVWYIITSELNLYRCLVSPNRQPTKS
jgi:hypothetical protein